MVFVSKDSPVVVAASSSVAARAAPPLLSAAKASAPSRTFAPSRPSTSASSSYPARPAAPSHTATTLASLTVDVSAPSAVGDVLPVCADGLCAYYVIGAVLRLCDNADFLSSGWVPCKDLLASARSLELANFSKWVASISATSDSELHEKVALVTGGSILAFRNRVSGVTKRGPEWRPTGLCVRHFVPRCSHHGHPRGPDLCHFD